MTTISSDAENLIVKNMLGTDNTWIGHNARMRIIPLIPDTPFYEKVNDCNEAWSPSYKEKIQSDDYIMDNCLKNDHDFDTCFYMKPLNGRWYCGYKNCLEKKRFVCKFGYYCRKVTFELVDNPSFVTFDDINNKVLISPTEMS